MPEVREQFDAAGAAWGETGEIELDSGLDYGDGEVVRVRVRKLKGTARCAAPAAPAGRR